MSLALKEVEAYTLFQPHPNIIHSIDHCVVSDKNDPGSKTVYILLPYYRRGNLQDIINANLVNHARFEEERLMVLFLGVCRALRALHKYKTGSGSSRRAKRVREEGERADREVEQEIREDRRRHNRDQEEVEAEPLMDGEVVRSQRGVEPGQTRSYAHRDIKPGNIMIADDGKTPILMDLGSLQPSPTHITSRSQAIAVQDQAAEHSTMPYRAPELFDVKTNSTIDTKVDIWSLGCTLYACLIGKSPFEARSEETGGSLSLCVLGGDWRFPDEGRQSRGKQRATSSSSSATADAQPGEPVVSDTVKDVVRSCLRVEPNERPDIDELIAVVEDIVGEMPMAAGAGG